MMQYTELHTEQAPAQKAHIWRHTICSRHISHDHLSAMEDVHEHAWDAWEEEERDAIGCWEDEVRCGAGHKGKSEGHSCPKNVPKASKKGTADEHPKGECAFQVAKHDGVGTKPLWEELHQQERGNSEIQVTGQWVLYWQ